MTRATIGYVVNTLLAIMFLAIAFIGIVLGFFVTHGPRAGWRGVWGLNHDAWANLHLYLTLTLMALIVAHLVLHWGWLMRTARRRLPRSFIA